MRNLASLSQCCETRNLVRVLARNDQYFKHHPQYVQIFCKRVHPTILTTYVQTFLPTCKEPYTVSTCHARQGLQDDTMESQEKSGTRLARSRSKTDLYKNNFVNQPFVLNRPLGFYYPGITRSCFQCWLRSNTGASFVLVVTKP